MGRWGTKAEKNAFTFGIRQIDPDWMSWNSRTACGGPWKADRWRREDGLIGTDVFEDFWWNRFSLGKKAELSELPKNGRAKVRSKSKTVLKNDEGRRSGDIQGNNRSECRAGFKGNRICCKLPAGPQDSLHSHRKLAVFYPRIPVRGMICLGPKPKSAT